MSMFPKVPDGDGINSENYLRLKGGESAVGVFRGEAHLFRQHWGQSTFSTTCKGPDCAECKEGKRSNFRFRINFVTKINGQYVAKVFEQGKKVYTLLNSIHAEADLSKHVVKLMRFGSTKEDTQYQVIPQVNGNVTPEMEKQLALVPLNNLGEQPSSPQSDFEVEEEVPF